MPRRVLQGSVVSDKADKTVVVKVSRRVMHPVYKKTVMQSTKYSAHDETNRFKVGDSICIIESRPISKTKKWKAVEESAVAQELASGEEAKKMKLSKAGAVSSKSKAKKALAPKEQKKKDE